MTLQQIGLISLNISTTLYFVWFIPQLRLTFQRRDVAGLSIGMHTLLFAGYLLDLIYGFGRHMPLQYRLVTLSGISALIIQHVQFFYYGAERRKFIMATALLGVLIILSIYSLWLYPQSIAFYDTAGMVANVLWFSFVIPQIWRNNVLQSAQAVSFGFILLGIITNCLDLVSAYTLAWDWPSKIGGEIGLLLKLILLYQIIKFSSAKKASDLVSIRSD